MRGSITCVRVGSLVLGVAAACGPGPRSGDDTGGVDARSGGPDAPPGEGEVAVFAHTSSTLFRVDPDTLQIARVGDFGWPGVADTMTDIAIDSAGVMIGVSFTSVYRIDPATAQTTLLSSGLSGEFNGLSFVPGEQATGNPEAADVLVGTRNLDGAVFSIDPMTGQATQIGNMGGGFSSSGDLVSVRDFGTAATTTGVGADVLVRLAAVTFAAQAIGTDTGYGDIWGVGFWKGKIYGFTDGGAFVLIDPVSGAATLVTTTAEAWWGAAVTTRAPVVE